MIFPLWVGYDRPHALGMWPLILLIGTNIGIHYYMLDLYARDPDLAEGIIHHIGKDSLTFRHLILSSFLHGNAVHLFGNMWFMWLFGQPIAGGLRARVFFLVYFGAVLIGNLMQTLLGDGGGSIGSSTGVAGLMGFFVTHFLRQGVTCLLVVVPITLPAWLLVGAFIGWDVYTVYSGKDTNIANWAHIGGFLAGLLYGRIIYQLDERRYAKLR